MQNKIYKISVITSITLLPFIALAVPLDNTGKILAQVLVIVRGTLIPIAFTAGLLFFFWGVALYIRSSGEEKSEGKKIMLWGVVALFVMSTIWGIIAFVKSELPGVTDDTAGTIPTIR